MFKLDLEKAEESEIKLPTAVGSLKKNKSVPEKIYFCFIDYYIKAFDCIHHNKLWKIIQEVGIPDHLRNLYADQEATVITGRGTIDCSKSGKEYIKFVYCKPAYLTYMQSTS